MIIHANELYTWLSAIGIIAFSVVYVWDWLNGGSEKNK